MRLVFLALAACTILAAADDQQFNGRWNITANNNSNRPHVWWLEVTGAGTGMPHGRFLGGPIAQVEDVPRISISDGELRFAFQPRPARDQKTSPQKLLYFARLEDGVLKGTFELEGDPTSYLEWTGVRAPVIPDKEDVTWKRGDPITLFDGHDLNGWQAQTSFRSAAWSVKDGLLESGTAAPNLITEKKFWNFVLHAEFRVSAHANSGIGLRGRYEVQVADDFDRPPSPQSTGAIVGRIAPSFNAADLPGVWQVIDIRLVGRQVTVTLNDIKIIDKQPIEGPTSIALDVNEADPGPILLQGERGPIEFRKIVLYPLTKPH